MEADSQYVLNYANKIQIKNSNTKGRGMFAKEDIQKGDLIIVERASASIKIKTDTGNDARDFEQLSKKCVQIGKLGDIQALRLN
jgi:hypothetical protein